MRDFLLPHRHKEHKEEAHRIGMSRLGYPFQNSSMCSSLSALYAYVVKTKIIPGDSPKLSSYSPANQIYPNQSKPPTINFPKKLISTFIFGRFFLIGVFPVMAQMMRVGRLG